MSKPKKTVYDHLTFRLAQWDEEEKIIAFVNDNFDWKLPLVNNRSFFEYYYYGKRLQFALAEQDGALVAIAGYILANESETPDLWVSVWVALKGAMGAGLELMNALPTLTNATVIACNNIRENTCAFYRFLGWTAERLPHYYRLGVDAAAGKALLYRPAKDGESAHLPLPSTCPQLPLTPCNKEDVLRLRMPTVTASQPQTPAKDTAYMLHRYFENPYFTYQVSCIQEGDALLAYCITRTVQATFEDSDATATVLRVVDFIGDAQVLPRIAHALDAKMQAEGAEYTDCYCAGIPADLFAAAGFTARTPESGEIVPNYLTPALIANTEYFYFTNQPEGFTMFKADGDQDRPNLP